MLCVCLHRAPGLSFLQTELGFQPREELKIKIKLTIFFKRSASPPPGQFFLSPPRSTLPVKSFGERFTGPTPENKSCFHFLREPLPSEATARFSALKQFHL